MGERERDLDSLYNLEIHCYRHIGVRGSRRFSLNTIRISSISSFEKIFNSSDKLWSNFTDNNVTQLLLSN